MSNNNELKYYDDDDMFVDFPRKASHPSLFDSAVDFSEISHRKKNDIPSESFFEDDTTAVYDEYQTFIDTRESKSHYYVNVVVPGLSAEEFKVEVVKGILMISGKVHQDEEEKKMKIWKQERKYGTFGRAIKLPKDASHHHVKASLQQGILQVKIDKNSDEFY
eukprot:gene123-4369_t